MYCLLQSHSYRSPSVLEERIGQVTPVHGRTVLRALLAPPHVTGRQLPEEGVTKRLSPGALLIAGCDNSPDPLRVKGRNMPFDLIVR